VARLGRKPVRPGRAAIAVSLGALGMFVISMAVGLGTAAGGWPIGAVGVAMVIVSVALLTTASMRGGDRSFVEGTVRVVQVSEPPVIATEYGRCEMQVLVQSPSHPGQTVMIRDPRVPVEKWPEVGDSLPALIAVSDARRVKIQWDRVGVYADDYDEFDEMGLYGDEPAVAESTSEFATVQPDPLPKRKPQPVPVLEGELVPTRQPGGDESAMIVDALDFSDVAEPAPPEHTPEPTPEPEPQATPQQQPKPQKQAQPRPAPAGGGSVFMENTAAHVLATQPPARPPATSGTIHGVGYTVQVTDLARSQSFYHDILGFYELDGGLDSVVLASGDTRIVLMTTQDAESVRKRLVYLNLEVGDVEAVYQELKVRGIRFTRPPRVVRQGERLEQISASFRDPDGHGIAITQWKAVTPAT
jgi:resuscitation-promoting factor RpfA